MKPTVEQIRQLATSAARYIKQSRALDEPLDEMIDDLENILAAVWPQVFPETVPPEGAIEVTLVVQTGVSEGGRPYIDAERVDKSRSAEKIISEMRDWVGHVTHGPNVVRFYLPPTPKPIVISSIAAEVEVRE